MMKGDDAYRRKIVPEERCKYDKMMEQLKQVLIRNIILFLY